MLINDLCDYLSLGAISLQWPDSGMTNAYLRSQVITAEYSSGIRSLESAVKKLNPDWSQEEIDSEISRLKSINLGEVKNIFDNIGNDDNVDNTVDNES
jgi:hypothetical protein